MNDGIWVIFDTSQYPDYYRDVHNLLAYPGLATMRYDYKEKYLSDRAIECAKANRPMPILFVYTQKAGTYKRGDGRSEAPANCQETLYFATRLGQMLAVTQTGETYYFDFQLHGYPVSDGKILDALLDPLRRRSEVPWGKEENGSPKGKWLAISDDAASYGALSSGDDQRNWSAIANQLMAEPSQFSGDSFWRLKGPYKYGSGEIRPPEIVQEKELGRTRKAEAIYSLPENGLWRFEAISEAGKRTGARPQYCIDVTSTDEKALKPVGAASVGLRRSTGEMIVFRTEPAALIGKTLVHYRLATRPQPEGWVVGPDLAFKFSVHRNRLRLFWGTLLGLLGALAYVAGDSDALSAHHPILGAAAKFLGILTAVTSAFVLTGKVRFDAK